MKGQPLAGCLNRGVGGAPDREVVCRADLDVGLDGLVRVDVAGTVRLKGGGESQIGAITEPIVRVAGGDADGR